MMVMTWTGNSFSDGKAMLEHVVTVILKQLMNGPLAKALKAGNVYEIMDVFILNQSARDVPS